MCVTINRVCREDELYIGQQQEGGVAPTGFYDRLDVYNQCLHILAAISWNIFIRVGLMG